MVLADLASQSSTKSQIINILNKESPLTAKQVYNKIIKQGISIRYQRVYENLRDMISLGILVKEGVNYSLSDKWVMDTCVTMERIKIRHIIRPFLKDSGNEKTKTIKFSSYRDYVNFIRTYMRHFIENVDKRNKNAICWLVYHSTQGVYNTGANVELAKLMKKKNIERYIAVSGNTAMDKVVKIMDGTIGLKNMVLGVPNRFDMSFAVYNDVAICTIFSPKIKEGMEKMYEESNCIEGKTFKIPEYIAKISNYLDSIESEITVVIVLNPTLVNTYRNYVLSFFEPKNDDNSS